MADNATPSSTLGADHKEEGGEQPSQGTDDVARPRHTIASQAVGDADIWHRNSDTWRTGGGA